MRFLSVLPAMALLFALPACNTIEGMGEDMAAIGQGFGNLFNDSVQGSQQRMESRRAQRGNMNSYDRPAPQSPYGGNGGGYNDPYAGAAGGGYGGGYQNGGGSAAYGGGAPSQQYPPYYQQQPTQPSVPYYYNQQ